MLHCNILKSEKSLINFLKRLCEGAQSMLTMLRNLLLQNLLPEHLFHGFTRTLRAEQALMFLRVVTGLFFLYQGNHKLEDPSFAVGLRSQLENWALHNPLFWYQDILRELAAPNADLIALVLPWLEVGIGFSLIAGFLLHLSLPLMVFLNLNFLLATQHTGAAAVGINLAFIFIAVCLYWSQAGLYGGLDRYVMYDSTQTRRSTKRSPSGRKAPKGMKTARSKKVKPIRPVELKRTIQDLRLVEAGKKSARKHREDPPDDDDDDDDDD